jgi:hypothetical protein
VGSPRAVRRLRGGALFAALPTALPGQLSIEPPGPTAQSRLPALDAVAFFGALLVLGHDCLQEVSEGRGRIRRRR